MRTLWNGTRRRKKGTTAAGILGSVRVHGHAGKGTAARGVLSGWKFPSIKATKKEDDRCLKIERILLKMCIYSLGFPAFFNGRNSKIRIKRFRREGVMIDARVYERYDVWTDQGLDSAAD